MGRRRNAASVCHSGISEKEIEISSALDNQQPIDLLLGEPKGFFVG
jgi:hypothetical protein